MSAATGVATFTGDKVNCIMLCSTPNLCFGDTPLLGGSGGFEIWALDPFFETIVQSSLDEGPLVAAFLPARAMLEIPLQEPNNGKRSDSNNHQPARIAKWKNSLHSKKKPWPGMTGSPQHLSAVTIGFSQLKVSKTRSHTTVRWVNWIHSIWRLAPERKQGSLLSWSSLKAQAILTLLHEL